MFGYSLEDFKEEARDLLDRAEKILDDIRVNLSDPEGINALFRTIHSLKGSSAYVGVKDVTEFAHNLESFLGLLRGGELKMTEEVVHIVTRSCDYLNDRIFDAEGTSVISIDENIENQAERLKTALGMSGTAAAQPSTQEAPVPQIPAPQIPTEEVPTIAPMETQVPAEKEIQEAEQPQVTPQAAITEETKKIEEIAQFNEDIKDESSLEAIDDSKISIKLDEDDVVKIAVKKQVIRVKELIENQSDDKSRIHEEINKLSETISWAFGDDLDEVIEGLEKLLTLLEEKHTLELTDFIILNEDFEKIIPMIEEETGLAIVQKGVEKPKEAAPLVTLEEEKIAEIEKPEAGDSVDSLIDYSDTETKEEVDHLHLENEVKVESVDDVFETKGSTDTLTGANVDEIVKITVTRDLGNLINYTNEETIDRNKIRTVLDRINDLNQWAFYENEKITAYVNSLNGILNREDHEDIKKELQIRCQALQRTCIDLLEEKIAKEEMAGKILGFEESTGEIGTGPVQAQKARQFAGARRGSTKSQGTFSTLKVRTDDVENLIQTVGSMSSVASKDLELLQAATLELRMVPVGEIFGRFNKVVRDLNQELGKEMQIIISGEEVKLDKMIADKLAEPLMHMVRNSAAHGIEDSARREALGKGPAFIRLNAYHEGGQVVIEVQDNGGGINVEKVKEKAIKTGILTEENSHRLSRQEIIEHIFAPGFSTKDETDSVSGRGVGMDVVKETISSLQGTVVIDTKENIGTTFRIYLPLTLAIIRGMVLEQGGNKIAVPSGSVHTILTMTSNELSDATIIEHGKEALYLKEEGDIMPIVNFAKMYNIKEREDKKTIVILKTSRETKTALIVDEAVGRRPLTVKPLDRFAENKYFSSLSIVEDEVILILNVPSLLAA